MQAKKQYHDNIGSLVVEDSSGKAAAVADSVGMPKVNKRRDHIRKTSTTQDDALKSNKLKKSYNGAKNHNEYEEFHKSHVITFSCLVRETNMSMNIAATGMQTALSTNGVNLSSVSCTRQIAKALNNECVNVSPEKVDSVALPSSI